MNLNLKFQHNKKIIVNLKTYKYVREYKKQLVKNITQLLNDLDIKFVISHGNLLEYERRTPIYEDDDVDIRMNIDDKDKWILFCADEKNKINIKYNLKFDDRFTKMKQQFINGIQVELLNFVNNTNINVYNIDIHLDLVFNYVESNIWKSYNIDFNNLRKIKYLEIATYAPSKTDTDRVLRKDYGKYYLIPKYKLQNINDIDEFKPIKYRSNILIYIVLIILILILLLGGYIATTSYMMYI
jgi:hypothetical protein